MSKQNVAEQMRTLPWNFRLNFWINQYNLVIALLSVPVAVVLLILLVHLKRAVTDWPVVLTLVAGLFTFAYTVQKQGLEESKLFRDLFGDFNRRYDEMDPQLNQILWEDDKRKALTPEQKVTLSRYFNLCAEELLYFRKGYIDPRVWDAWIKGMAIYCQSERIREFWSAELRTNAYYGFVLPWKPVMDTPDPTPEPSPFVKVLVPTIVLAITFFIPRWYWVAMDHAQSRSGSHQATFTVGTVPGTPGEAQPKTGTGQPAGRTQPPWKDPQWVIVFITAIYVVITGIYALFAWFQLRAIKRQGNLQQSAMQQWVELGREWDSEISEDKHYLFVRFALNNPTKFPLTVLQSELVFGLRGFVAHPILEDGFLLTPDNPKRIERRITLSAEEAQQYTVGQGITFSVRLEITHTDMGPSGKNFMRFSGYLTCQNGRGNTRFDQTAKITI